MAEELSGHEQEVVRLVKTTMGQLDASVVIEKEPFPVPLDGDLAGLEMDPIWKVVVTLADGEEDVHVLNGNVEVVRRWMQAVLLGAKIGVASLRME